MHSIHIEELTEQNAFMFFMPIVRLVVTITSTGSHRYRVEVATHGVLHR